MVAIRATSSMAAWASPMALVVEPVAAATASTFSAIWLADWAASDTSRFISVVVAVCSSTAAPMVLWESSIWPMAEQVAVGQACHDRADPAQRPDDRACDEPAQQAQDGDTCTGHDQLEGDGGAALCFGLRRGLRSEGGHGVTELGSSSSRTVKSSADIG